MIKPYDKKLHDNEFIDEHSIVPRAKKYLEAGLNLALIGYPGCAKTTLVAHLAGGSEKMVTAMGGQLNSRDLAGRRVLIDGTSVWQPGFAQTAASGDGRYLFIDEGDQIMPDCWPTVASLLDSRRQLVIPELAMKINAGPNFRVIISYNPASAGFDAIPRSARDRFVFIEVPRLSAIAERQLIINRYGITSDEANYLVRYASVTREAVKQEDGASTRQIEAAAAAVSNGVAPRLAAQDAILNPICASNPSLRSAISNALLADGLEFTEAIRSVPKPTQRRSKVRSDRELLR